MSSPDRSSHRLITQNLLASALQCEGFGPADWLAIEDLSTLIDLFCPYDRSAFISRSDLDQIWFHSSSPLVGVLHGVGNDPTYNNTTCFETFPFPWPLGTEPLGHEDVQAIADAARDLVEKRRPD